MMEVIRTVCVYIFWLAIVCSIAVTSAVALYSTVSLVIHEWQGYSLLAAMDAIKIIASFCFFMLMSHIRDYLGLRR